MNPVSRYLWVGGVPYVSPEYYPGMARKEQMVKPPTMKRHEVWAIQKRERLEREKSNGIQSKTFSSNELANSSSSGTDKIHREVGNRGTVEDHGISTSDVSGKRKPKRRTRRVPEP
jgi:hypothetical protein